MGVMAPSVSQNVFLLLFTVDLLPPVSGVGPTLTQRLAFDHGWAGPCPMALGVPHSPHPQCARQQPSNGTPGVASRLLPPLARGLCWDPTLSGPSAPASLTHHLVSTLQAPLGVASTVPAALCGRFLVCPSA